MTNYPAQIDTSISLPSAVDNLTPVMGSVVNRLRDAILAIETELGIKPSGLYTTVRARLDAIEAGLNSLQIISLAGDLGGTLTNPKVIGIQGRPVSTVPPNLNDVLVWDGIAWVPAPQSGGGGGGFTAGGDLSGLSTSQRVIGLQGRPVSSTAPTTNQVLTWNGTAWIPKGVATSPYSANLNVTPTLTQVGSTVATPPFTASYSGGVGPPVTAVFTDSDGNAPVDVIATPTAFNSPYSYTKNAYGVVETFTLTTSDGNSTVMPTATTTWTQLVYWGVGPAGGGGAAFIQGLASSQLQLSRNGTFTVNAGPTQKVYYAYRTAYGAATFTVGGFSGGFSADSTTISVTNTNGFTENYTLYESDNLGLGNITVVVT